jgi:choline monooxygenase
VKPLPEASLREGLEHALTPPGAFYTDPSRLAPERTRIFWGTWQWVGRLADLGKAGDYFTTEVAGEPVLVLRNSAGDVGAFHNVCAHRAGPVAQGAGCRPVLQCGYHGWTYTLEGRLLRAPEMEGVQGFESAAFGLRPLRASTWGPFVFVNVDGQAPPLLEWLEGIPARLERFTLDRMTLVERRSYEVRCNWKVYVDNYVEGYHIRIVHPAVMREVDYAQYRVLTYGSYSEAIAPLRQGAPADGKARHYPPGAEVGDVAYLWLFPNLMLSVYPGNLQLNLVEPDGPDKTRVRFEWYGQDAGTDGATTDAIRKAVDLADVVQHEDIAICEAVQRGLQSVAYTRGRYSVKRENGVFHFHH